MMEGEITTLDMTTGKTAIYLIFQNVRDHPTKLHPMTLDLSSAESASERTKNDHVWMLTRIEFLHTWSNPIFECDEMDIIWSKADCIFSYT